MATVGANGGLNGKFPGGAPGISPTSPTATGKGFPVMAHPCHFSARCRDLILTANSLVFAKLCLCRVFFVFYLGFSTMAGGRKQAPARVPNEGGHAKPGVKGKNFNRAEEEQLCRSVIFVSQDRIVGNQQKTGVFWERICEHYEDHRPDAPRPQRSLETKWGLIKHDVSSFCGVYAQVLRLNKSGTSVSDTLRRARELYQQKSAKKQEFAFEHCWLLLKDHPKWADGWSAPKATSSMRVPAASASSPGNQCDPGRSSGGCVQSDAEA